MRLLKAAETFFLLLQLTLQGSQLFIKKFPRTFDVPLTFSVVFLNELVRDPRSYPSGGLGILMQNGNHESIKQVQLTFASSRVNHSSLNHDPAR